MSKDIEQIRYKAAKEVLANGLTDYRNAVDDWMRSINKWHDAANLLRETPKDHPLHNEARIQYEDTVSHCANLEALAQFERMRFERAWNQGQDEKEDT